MAPHYPGHLVAGVAALAATLALYSLTVNRFVRRKLRLSIFLLAAYVLLNLLLRYLVPENLHISDADLNEFERLAFAAALINLAVIALVNPLRSDRVPDRFPTIVQDFMVIGLFILAATLISDRFVATSAVSAVVVGFALQDTLGNAFAGLALQSEKPFHVGQWVRVGDFEGRVAEITWRATKLRTKTGNFVVLPNNVVSKEAIINYSEPAAPTRIEVEVGATYLAPPTSVKRAIYEALANCSRVLAAPAPDVLLVNFDSSAITYRARFWVEDYERDEAARDQVRTAIYYAFQRDGIEIPWPIQVEYRRAWKDPDLAERQLERERLLAAIDLFVPLTDAERAEIAASTITRVFGDGEAIVRQGAQGHSMFAVCRGRAVVTVDDGRQVATIEAGGYFGEMSLLTGQPRTATVTAAGDTTVLEIDADVFRRLGDTNAAAVEKIGLAAVARRVELEQVRSAGRSAAVVDAPATFVARMRKFLRL